jgi:hypothetical protein
MFYAAAIAAWIVSTARLKSRVGTTKKTLICEEP